MAVKLELITSNPSDHVELPKKNRFVGSFYNSDELNELFAATKGTKLEIPVLFGAFYGLRRSEVVGLKWDAIDFENNTITIRHTVTTCRIDGKKVVVAADRTKNKSSMRTLPLVPFFKERLLYLQDQQNKQRKLCGGSYCRDFLGYICVDEIGVLIKPDYISAAFPKLLDGHGLRRIRFHDLRHSCASLMLAHGVQMKDIQECSVTAIIRPRPTFTRIWTTRQSSTLPRRLSPALTSYQSCLLYTSGRYAGIG